MITLSGGQYGGWIYDGNGNISIDLDGENQLIKVTYEKGIIIAEGWKYNFNLNPDNTFAEFIGML